MVVIYRSFPAGPLSLPTLSLPPLPAPRQVEIPLIAASTNHQRAVVAPPHTC